jgi:hypothetical protein
VFKIINGKAQKLVFEIYGKALKITYKIHKKSLSEIFISRTHQKPLKSSIKKFQFLISNFIKDST